MSQFNYCELHQLTFSSDQEYDFHKRLCETYLENPLICKQNRDGALCLHQSNYISEYILHYKIVHNLYICSDCGSSFVTLEELQRHSHQSTTHLGILTGN